jgi:hypothetical protein
VQEDLHEGILHRLVGIGRIAQILERDPDGPTLQQRDQRAKPLARLVPFTGLDQRLDFGGQKRCRRRMGVGLATLALGGEIGEGLSCQCLRKTAGDRLQ